MSQSTGVHLQCVFHEPWGVDAATAQRGAAAALQARGTTRGMLVSSVCVNGGCVGVFP